MWANSLQPAKLRPGQPCSRDTTFSVVSPGPGRGALFGCRGTGSLAGQRRKHGKLHAASAAGLQSRPRKRALDSPFTTSFSFLFSLSRFLCSHRDPNLLSISFAHKFCSEILSKFQKHPQNIFLYLFRKSFFRKVFTQLFITKHFDPNNFCQ
jgi:hypothetical protein